MNSDVVSTVHNEDGYRCVKIIARLDGRFGFQEYRRDPEDAGGWTFVGENCQGPYPTQGQALAAAQADVAWLQAMTSSAKGAR